MEKEGVAWGPRWWAQCWPPCTMTKRVDELEQRGREPGLLRPGAARPPGPLSSPAFSEAGGLHRAEEAGSSPTPA